MRIKKIEFPVRRNGFIYELNKREQNIALVEVYDSINGGALAGYEVWKVKQTKPFVFEAYQNEYDLIERQPSTKDWGLNGFSYVNFIEAKQKFEELLKASVK